MRAQLTPIKNQEFVFNQAFTELSKEKNGVSHQEQVEKYSTDLVKVIEAEIALWQKKHDELESLLIKLDQIRMPFKAVISYVHPSAQQKLHCRAGVPLMTLQPLDQVVRLWQIDHFDDVIVKNTKLKLQSQELRKTQQAEHLGVVQAVGPQLQLLPESLQVFAQQKLGLQPLFGQATLVRGLPIKVNLQEKDTEQGQTGFNLPWGMMILGTP